jgi:hypothetical protein
MRIDGVLDVLLRERLHQLRLHQLRTRQRVLWAVLVLAAAAALW